MSLPATGSLLGLDVSKRRIGLAGTDPDRRLVTPLHTMTRTTPEADLRQLAVIVRARAVVGLVLGLPLNMDDSEGPMARVARSFGKKLAGELALPLHLQDERLSTFAVEQAIEEGRLARPKRGQPLDHYAAAVILEDALRLLRAS